MSVLPGPFGEAVSRLERRFLTTAVVPTVIFLTASSAVAISAFDSSSQILEFWRKLGVGEQLIAALVGGSLVWFLAAMISSNWRKIVRLYEGYPLAHLYRRLATRRHLELWWVVQWIPGAAYHFNRQRSVSSRTAYRRYAPAEYDYEVLPTTIGNILLSAERYALHRYGLDITLLWPRLYWQIPADVRTDLDAFKEEHQLPIALSFMAFCFSVLSGILVIIASGSWELFATATSGGMLISIIAYFLSIERAEEYGEQLKATVDLHHQGLRGVWAEPATDEKEFYARTQFFVVNGSYRTDVDVSPTGKALDDRDTAAAREKRPPKPYKLMLQRVRMSVFATVASVLCIVFFSFVLHSREQEVVVPVNDVSAFSVIKGVKKVRMARSELPRRVLTGTTEVVGRLAQRPLKAGQPLSTNDLVTVDPATESVITRLSVTPGRLPAGVLPGDRVNVAVPRCRVYLTGVMVLQSDESAKAPTITIGVAARARDQLAACVDAAASIYR